MTMKQIQANTPRDRKILVPYVSITHLKKKQTKPDRRRILQAITSSTGAPHPRSGQVLKKKEKNRYITYVEALQGDSKPLGKSYIKVSCECGDFWSHWEYALNRRGAADIEYSNGEPPVVTNPTLIAGACKHIMAMFQLIQHNGW